MTYSPESNGVAERKNRTLKEMMNAMLISSNAPDNLWGESLLVITHASGKPVFVRFKAYFTTIVRTYPRYIAQVPQDTTGTSR